MKILAIGDFHGTFPKKFEGLIKKEDIDIVVTIGDFFPFHYRKLWFKHSFRSGTELWEVIGKKKYKQLVLKDLKMGEGALRALNKLPVPVITVVGNNDHGAARNDQYPASAFRSKWAWADTDFFALLLKKYRNIKRFDYSYFLFGDYVFIGSFGGSSRGMLASPAYKKHRKLLDKMFARFSRENKEKKVIFVSHNVPYNTKLDKINMKAHELVRGKHMGSRLIKRVIQRWKPLLHLGGHIHEGFGQDKVGKTICLNVGSAHEGEAAIIDLRGKKPAIKLIR